MIRAGENERVLRHFLNRKIAYLAWGDTGPNQSQPPNLIARMVREFCNSVSVGDAVVTYDPSSDLSRLWGIRRYHIGKVRSEAELSIVKWGPGKWSTSGDTGFVREVDWLSLIHI